MASISVGKGARLRKRPPRVATRSRSPQRGGGGIIFRIADDKKTIAIPRWALVEIGDELRELAALLSCLARLQRGVTATGRASKGESEAADRIGRVARGLRLSVFPAAAPSLGEAVEAVGESVRRRLGRAAFLLAAVTD